MVVGCYLCVVDADVDVYVDVDVDVRVSVGVVRVGRKGDPNFKLRLKLIATSKGGPISKFNVRLQRKLNYVLLVK